MKTELLAWLINATVAVSFAGLAILLLRKPLQRWLGAEIAYRLWIVLPLAALAACFSLPHAAPVAVVAAPVAITSAPAIVVRANQAISGLNADRWLLAIWVCGALMLIGVLVWQQRRYVSRLRLRRDRDGSWRSALSDAAPAVLGVLRQKLVLPDAFETSYSIDEQQLVIAHERMHQQRRDPWALAVCAGMRALFWFNPIVHAAAVRFRRDVELACDAAVLRAHPGSRQRYANALLKTHIVDGALPVGCLWENTPPMKERIMLLKQGLPARRTRMAGAILVAIASLGVAGFALAGHDSAVDAAAALAASSAAGRTGMPVSAGHRAYALQLHMSVDGKHVGDPKVVSHVGAVAKVKLVENEQAIGFTFHVEPQADPGFAEIVGEVTGAHDQVVGNPRLVVAIGTPSAIEVSDKSGTHVYRIDIVASVADAAERRADMDRPGMGRATGAHSRATAGDADSDEREVEIVRNGPPEPGDAAGDEEMHDDEMPGAPIEPGASREIRREVTVMSPSDRAPNVAPDRRRVERRVIVTTRGEAATPPTAPLPPLPPLPPRPHAMRAPPPPPAPPVAADMPAPPMPPPPPHGVRAPLAPPPPPPPRPAMPPPAPPIPPAPPPGEPVSMQMTQPPPYPRAALKGNIGGKVVMKVLVGSDGAVKHATVASSQPAGVFDQASLDAVKRWHFNPARDAKGRPVQGYVMVPIEFDPHDRGR